MKYIHELNTWPKFIWDHEKIASLLGTVRSRQGRLLGRMEAMGFSLRAEALLQTLTLDVVKSSEIEGEALNQSQVRSSIARKLGINIGGLIPSDRYVDGIVEMMLDATQNFNKPLTKDRLFSWHASLFPSGRSGMHKIIVGAWRNDSHGPMRVVSGGVGHEHVHFEAPDAKRLNREMKDFLTWFNGSVLLTTGGSASSGTGESAPILPSVKSGGNGDVSISADSKSRKIESADLDPVLKAGIAHLWFATLHPFEDGNGRIARAIADMQLARADESRDRFYSMSVQIRQERNAYYDILEKTQKNTGALQAGLSIRQAGIDITPWLMWFLACLTRALEATENTLSGVFKKARFWELHPAGSLNDRQQLMINKLFDGFDGKLTSSKWANIAKCSQDTAFRDILDLVEKGILFKDSAGGRSTSYLLKGL